MAELVAIWVHDDRDGHDYFSRVTDPRTATRYLGAATSRGSAFHYFALDVSEMPWSPAHGQWALLQAALEARAAA